MANIVNYYEELNISKDLSLEEVNAELVKLERVWHQREINQPEKARKMLTLIDDARSVFQSDEARKDYDYALENDNEDNVNVAVQGGIEKQINTVRGYLNSKEYDLAKIALEKALNANQGQDNPELFSIAATVYAANRDYDSALRYINEAIVLAPDTPDYYQTKGFIYSLITKAREKAGDKESMVAYATKSYGAYKVAYEKASANPEYDFLKSLIAMDMTNILIDSPRLLHTPRDMELVERLVKEAVVAFPDAEEILRYSGIDAEKEELDCYNIEKNVYEAEIKECVDRIIEEFPGLTEKQGWILEEVSTFFCSTDMQERDTEVTTKYRFVLNGQGKLCEYVDEERDIEDGWPGHWHCTHEHTSWMQSAVFDASSVGTYFLAQFDFDVYWNMETKATSNGKVRRNGRYMEEIFRYANSIYSPDSDDMIRLARKSFKKGYGLYCALQKILEIKSAPITVVPEPPKPPVQQAPAPAPVPSPSPASSQSGGMKGGCYIATAVYGSYDCPEVWVLRRFRDNMLAQTWFGRLFIKIYYAISPSMVRHFGEAKWFTDFWRNRLDDMISKLKQNGLSDAPYND